MTLKELENFIALADEGSFSRTAKLLYLTQQTLSAQISRIEDELGVSLFIRGRDLVLTYEGVLFYKTASEIIRLRNQYDIDIQQHKLAPASLHIGIQHTTARSILPTVLPKFFAKFPNVTVKFEESEPEKTVKSLDYAAVDLAIGPKPDDEGNYHIIPLAKKSQLLIVPRLLFDNYWGDEAESMAETCQAKADLTLFESFPFLNIREGLWAGDIIKAYCEWSGIKPRFVMECTNIDVAFNVACSGVGCLIYSRFFYTGISKELRDEYSKKVYAFPLPDLESTDYLYAFFLKRRSLSLPAAEFIHILQEFFEQEQSLL